MLMTDFAPDTEFRADRAMAEALIRAAYNTRGLMEPAIVWCKSPWQLMVLPAIFRTAHHMQLRRRDFCDLLTWVESVTATSPKYRLWNQLMPVIRDSYPDVLDHMRWLRAFGVSLTPIKFFSEDLWQASARIGLGKNATPVDPLEMMMMRAMRRHLAGSLPNGWKLDPEADAIYSRYDLWNETLDCQLRWMLLQWESSLDSYLNSRIYRRRRQLQPAPVPDGGLSKQFGTNPLALAAELVEELTENFNEILGTSDLPSTLRDCASAVLFTDRICFIAERPSVLSGDAEGKLHSVSGPALQFADGYAIHFLHGIEVWPAIVEDPNTLTLEMIFEEMNVERRRVLIDHYGRERFVQDAGAQVRSKDSYGALVLVPIPGQEGMVFVRVLNSTPEPDGTFKTYFLRVPPYMTSPKAAVAWTFGLEADEYLPDNES